MIQRLAAMARWVQNRFFQDSLHFQSQQRDVAGGLAVGDRREQADKPLLAGWLAVFIGNRCV